jgi:hypothetical protein
MTTEPFDISSWPPSLTPIQLEALTLYATTYALSHGLLYLLPGPQPAVPSAAIHAPFSLFPSPFPRKLFETGQRIQRTYNVLYARIAMDEEFLDRVMGTKTGVGKVDDFIGQLWTGWKQLRDEGLAQVPIPRLQMRAIIQLSSFSTYILACFVPTTFSTPYRTSHFLSSRLSSIPFPCHSHVYLRGYLSFIGSLMVE